jgi:HPt (histidine-containing phosphotransfer) domain-containing protein
MDSDALLRRCNGKPVLAKKLLDIFQERAGGQIEEMRRLGEQQDSAALSRLAHSIKGSAANLSAESMHCRAIELEALIAASDAAGLSKGVENLVAEIQGLLAYIPKATEQLNEKLPAKSGAQG